MTDDESRKINDLHAEIVKIDEIHTFLMKPTGPGRPSRAREIDEALTAIRAGRLIARLSLWTVGFVAAVGAAWVSIKGLIK